MNRLPYRSDFALRLVFHDADNLPISMKGVDIDLWFSTKPGGAIFLAAARNAITTNCQVLDDGSLLVKFDDHRLQPGQLMAKIAIHSDDETMPDGKRDIHISPVIPIELTESTCSAPGHRHDTSGLGQPILVNIEIPISRPQLSHHITYDELNTAVNSLREEISRIRPCETEPATDKEIEEITNIFLI